MLPENSKKKHLVQPSVSQEATERTATVAKCSTPEDFVESVGH